MTSAKKPLTPEDLLRLQFVSDPRMSPDGRCIVFVRKHVGEKNDYVTNLWMVETGGADGEPRQFSSGGKDSHPRFSPDGTRIAFISGRDKPKPQIFTMPSSGGEATALTKFPEGSIAGFAWSPDGRMLAVSFREQDPQWTDQAKKDRETKGSSTPARVLDDIWYRLDGDGYFNGQRHRLCLVDAKTGEHRAIYKDTIGHFEYDFSPDSRQLVIATNRDRNAMLKPWKQELVRLDVTSGRVHPIPLPDGAKSCPRWSPDGKLIAYAGRAGKDGTYGTENLGLWICDPVKGGGRDLLAKTDYCLMAVTISDSAEVAFAPVVQWGRGSQAKRVFFKLGWHGQTHIASVPARGGKVAGHTRGDVSCDMGSFSADGKRLALTVATPIRPAEVVIGELSGSTMRVRTLTKFNEPLLASRRIVKHETAWVTAADGWKTQLWIVKPPDFKRGRKYPAVLEIHGGPHGQYGVGYFNEFQVLANAGYVVVFSNPRGSKGYGRDHTAAIRGAWGGADWVDVQAVTKFMQSRSYINPKRMGVMGGSYGGYMTNWVIGHCCDFAGAITDRCVANLVSMFGTSDYSDAPDHYWPGNSWDRPEKMWEMSPLKYLGNCKTPTLVIHSEGDLRCNVEQGEQVFTALKIRGVPTRFVRYPSTTFHGMSRNGPPDLRIHRLHQIISWWKRWL